MTLVALPVDSQPACAPYLDAVDAAITDRASDLAHWLADRICPTCPVAAACLLRGAAASEHGVWGGTTGKWRTEHAGAGQATKCRNLNGIHPRSDKGRTHAHG